MAMEFLDELGETISRRAKDLGKMAGQIYETQKIRSKVSSEEHMIAKLKADIGNYIYEKYQNGEEVEDALKGFCEEIQQHQEIIEGYKDSEAELKGQKICRSCGNSVDRSVSYCPYCGSPCPTPEAKEEPADQEPKEAAVPETDFIPEPAAEEEAASEEPEPATEEEVASEEPEPAAEEATASEDEGEDAPKSESQKTEN